jgi:hypothetical protein
MLISFPPSFCVLTAYQYSDTIKPVDLGASGPLDLTGLSAPIPQPARRACGISASIPCASLHDTVSRQDVKPYFHSCLDTSLPPGPSTTFDSFPM